MIFLRYKVTIRVFKWWLALATGENAEAFLGMQGYIWDTQSYMMYVFIGCIVALLVLSKYHDKQISRLIQAK